MKTFVIIPVYNEHEVVRQTVLQLIDKQYEVVIVDDGSATSPCSELGGLPVHFLRHMFNMGQGAALQTGMDYARQLGADIVIHFDADGQHSYLEIPSMIQPILDKQADIVVGTRFKRREDTLQVPLKKRMLLKSAVLINRFFSGLKLTDAHNGFRALNAIALNKINLKENRMAHATEILKQVKRKELRIVEVPTKINYTEYSQQKGQKPLNSINILFDLIVKSVLR